jgi:CheY-like chemotaxis protein
MNVGPEHAASAETILLVDGDVVVRMVIAEYLRHCGYKVIEAVSTDEALTVFQHEEIRVEIVLSDVKAPGQMNGFGLANWVRENRPELDVVLSGSLESAAEAARDICDDGPLKRPYEPQTVVERIRRLRAARDARQKK